MTATPQDVVSSLDAELAELKQTSVSYGYMVTKYGADPTKWPTSSHWYRALADHRAARDAALALIPTPPVPPDPPPDPKPPPSGALNTVGIPVLPENVGVPLNGWSSKAPRVVQPGGLNAALKAASPGDCLSLAAGNYDEYVDSAASDLTIRFQTGAVARNWWRLTGARNTIFDSTWRWVDGVTKAGGSIIYPNGAGALQLIGGDVRGTRWSASFFGSAICQDPRVLGFKFYDCGGITPDRENYDHCVYMGHARGAYVGYCLMQGKDRRTDKTSVGTAWGVQFYPDCKDGWADHITVVYVDKGGVIVDEGGDTGDDSSGCKVTNSIIAHTANGANAKQNQGYAARVTRGLGSCSADRCLHVDTPQASPWSGVSTSNILKTDPLFVNDTSDPAVSDFRLKAASPAVGKASDGLNLGCYV